MKPLLQVHRTANKRLQDSEEQGCSVWSGFLSAVVPKKARLSKLEEVTTALWALSSPVFSYSPRNIW